MVENLSTVDLRAERARGGDALAPGDLLLGRYRIEVKLGAGGMGEVYAARDQELDASIAIKVVREELAADPELRAQFRREVQLARGITHPNVCRLYDLEIDGPRLFLTMERIEGASLSSVLKAGPLGVARAVAIARQIAAGLAAAHRAGVVHRDIKPGNVLVDGDRAILTDFGLATPASSRAAVGGTPAYMAPETVAGGAATPAIDVYAFGCVVWELLHGAPPFARTELSQVVAAEPPRRASGDAAVDALVARCLDPDPAKRPADGDALVAALGVPRRRRWPWLVSAAGLLGAGVAAFALMRSPATADPRIEEARSAMRRYDAEAARLAVVEVESARGRAELAAAERLLGKRASAIAAGQAAVAAATDDTRLLAQARLADARDAWTDAVRAYDALAQTAPADLDLQLDLARVMTRAGQHERAASAISAARALGPDDPRVELQAAELAMDRGDLDAMERSATRARSLAGESSVIAAWARTQLASVREQRGDLDGATALLAEAEPVLARAAHCARQAGVHRQLASIAFRRSQLPLAATETSRAQVIARACGSRAEEVAAIASGALLAGAAGDHAAETRQLELALAGYRELADDAQVAWTLQSLGNAAFGANDVRGARERWNQALEVARRLGIRDRIAELLNNLGEAAFRQGDLPAARLYLDEARAGFETLGDRSSEAYVLGAQGDLALAADNRGEAQARYERALSLRETIGETARAAGPIAGLARIEIEDGKLDAAEARLSTAATAYPDLAAELGLVRLDVALRRLASGGGTLPAAREIRAKLDAAAAGDAELALRDAELALAGGDRAAARGHAELALVAFRAAGDVAGELRGRLAAARIAGARDELTAIAEAAAGRGLHLIARHARESIR